MLSYKNKNIFHLCIIALFGGFGILLIFASSLAASDDTVEILGKKYEKQLYPTRKEFATLVAATGNTSLEEIKESCFKDVSLKDREISAICLLKKKGVFTGSQKSKFYPNQKVNFSFALQSLCRLNHWTPKKTFSECKKYASQELGIIPLAAKTTLTYEKLAPLLSAPVLRPVAPERVPVAETAPASPHAQDEKTPAKIPEEKLPSFSFTPVPESIIAESFFAHLNLGEPLPNRFYLNEVYVISGNLTDVQSDEIFAFLCKEGTSCENSLNFIAPVEGSHFEIPLYFKAIGNYQIGIIPGRSGQSRVENISIVPKVDTPVGGEKANVLSVKYDKGKTTFHWDSEGSLSRLVIFQGTERRDYLFRNGLSAYSPDSSDFVNFKKGKAAWFIQHDSAQSAVQTIDLTTQEFRTMKTADIQIKNLPEMLKNPGTVQISAKALTPLAKKIAITLPSGKVQEIAISENNIAKDTSFTMDVNFPEEGTYIFEINNPEGAAVVNIPMYVGDMVPLLPDFFALNKGKLDPSPLANLSAASERLLKLINADRKANGLSQVEFSDALAEIAQKHAEDMVARNFFAHINPDSKGPDDRRKAAHYPSAIKENLGKAANLELAEAGLMRSPIHRAAILDPEVAHVGLGIAKNKEGYFLVTQNFSAIPFTIKNLPSLTDTLLKKADDIRTMKGLSLLSHDEMLRRVSENWSTRMATEDFFDIKDKQGATLLQTLRNNGINTAIQAFIVKAQDGQQLTDELQKQPGIENSTFKNIGIGLALNELGDLFMTVVYTL